MYLGKVTRLLQNKKFSRNPHGKIMKITIPGPISQNTMIILRNDHKTNAVELSCLVAK